MLLFYNLGRLFFRNTKKWAGGKLRSLQKNQSVFSTTSQYPPLSGPTRLSIPSAFILAICFSTALGVMPIRSARAAVLSELSWDSRAIIFSLLFTFNRVCTNFYGWRGNRRLMGVSYDLEIEAKAVKIFIIYELFEWTAINEKDCLKVHPLHYSCLSEWNCQVPLHSAASSWYWSDRAFWLHSQCLLHWPNRQMWRTSAGLHV